MGDLKRVFILGAGFSKPAGMPLATELLPQLVTKLQHDEMRKWVDGLCRRLAWLSGNNQQTDSFTPNIEQVFQYAHFDVEVRRLQQQVVPFGRQDGLTPWNQGESIECWLSYLEDALCDVVSEREDNCDLTPITRWAEGVSEHDAVLTFNYDTLAERGLAKLGKTWSHGMECEGNNGIPVYKLHGSIDWIVAHRSENSSKLELLFDKANTNRSDGKTGHVEDDCRLWRCRTREQRRNWIDGRDLQGGTWKTVGIAGLGAYKELHRIPGLGRVWTRGMRALYHADRAVVVGFAMSDFDAMAQMQLAEVAQARQRDGRPLPVFVVDPCANEASNDRFRRVFRSVEFISRKHEEFDWSSLS
ncbi:MAG: hypothetical protein IIC01_03335 [Planctomycetes bacterium]|nr:hypothetical protein [Planctomycetota bacterium]